MARVKLGGNMIAALIWTTALVAASSTAQPSSPGQAAIVVAPFEVLGEAPAALAQSMRSDLAAMLDLDPCIVARADREGAEPSATYVLRGSAYAEAGAGRAFVALQLVDAGTSERVWFENYDYRGITPEMMARDIVRYLKNIAPDAVRSRIRGSCNGP